MSLFKKKTPVVGLILAAFSLFASGQAASNNQNENESVPSLPAVAGTPPCDALINAGLREKVLLPSDDAYEPQIDTWFDDASRLHPWCLVLPESTEDVSQALKTLLGAGKGAGDWHIALRSGGHSVGAINNIGNGVTIDLSHLNATSYNPQTNLASVSPGSRWGAVFAALDKEGVAAVGGRDGGVGVGGFLLGGGTSFFSGTKGFGCDNVLNYEVVLADGNVVNANASCHSDLWKALKGGGGNFGIVTRFDLQAFPSKPLFHDLRFVPGNYSDVVVDTVVDFASHEESDGNNALVSFWMHDTSIANISMVGTIYVNTEGDSNAGTAYDNVIRVPALMNQTGTMTMAEAARGGQGIEPGSKVSTTTITFRNDPNIMREFIALLDDFTNSLSATIGADNYITMMFFQPLPSYYTDISQRKGGNMLGLENANQNAIMFTGGVMVKSSDADFALAKSKLQSLTSEMKKTSVEHEGSMDLIYLNYADPSQDSMESYGEANLRFLKEVANKYDPEGVFQKRFPAGFKLDRAG